MAGYKEIADVITEEIATGVLAPGAPVPSLHTICKEFKVSYMTSVHVHEELARRNLIIRNPAFRKTLVGPAMPEKKTVNNPIKNIVLLHTVYPVKKQNPEYSSELPIVERVIKEKCEEYSLGFSSLYNRYISWAEAGKLSKTLSPETGYIFAGISGINKENRLRLSTLFSLTDTPVKVYMDHIVPGCHCVINDYAGSVENLVRHLKKTGINEIIYLRKSFVLGNYYAFIRWNACKKSCERENIAMTTLEGTDHALLLPFMKEGNVRKKAIVCPQDTVADNCRIYLEKQGIKGEKLPVICGMDCVSFAKKEYPKFSIKFDIAQMAEKAFFLAVNSSPSDVICSIEEIPGKLVLPEDWEKERRKYEK